MQEIYRSTSYLRLWLILGSTSPLSLHCCSMDIHENSELSGDDRNRTGVQTNYNSDKLHACRFFIEVTTLYPIVNRNTLRVKVICSNYSGSLTTISCQIHTLMVVF